MVNRVRTTAALVAALALVAVTLGAPSAVAEGAPAVESRVAPGETVALQQQERGGDAAIDSGAAFWQGWQLALDASEFAQAGGSVEVWRVSEDGQLSQRVRTVALDGNASAVIDTTDLEGRYALRYDGQPVYVQDGVGYLDSPPDGTRVTVENSAWRARTQTLSVEWSDPSVYPGETTHLTVTSNRPDYRVAVSVPGLTFQNLTALFPSGTFAEGHDRRAGEDAIVLDGGALQDVRLNTDVLTAASGSPELDVVDTTASVAADLTVYGPEPDRRFRRVERTENVGDVIEAELACSSCYLVVGGDGQGILDVVRIRDSNGDGTVTVRINTRYAGLYTGADGYPQDAEAYSSPNDSVSRYSQSQTLRSVERELVTTRTTLNDLREALGLAGRGRLRPVSPRSIELTVSSSDFVVHRTDWGDRPPYGSDMIVRDHADAVTVDLRERSLDGVHPIAFPREGPLTVERLREVAVERETVALGDRLVFRIDVSGVYGYLARVGTGLESLVANEDEGLYLRLHRLGASETAPAESIRLDRLDATVVADPSADDLYLAIRTGGPSPSRLDAGRYRATLELRGVSGQYDDYSIEGQHDGYPYLAPGARESASGAADVAEPTGAILAPQEGTEPRMTAAGDLTLSGTTSVAPGSTLTVVVGSTQYAWETRTTTTVQPSGNWSAAVDLAEASGEEFEVGLFRGQDRLDGKTYTVRPPAPNATASDGGGGGNGSDGSGGGGGSGAGPAATGGGLLSGVADLAVPVGGGAGILIGIWALWRLVIRRLLV